jgi:hypothetical protein
LWLPAEKRRNDEDERSKASAKEARGVTTRRGKSKNDIEDNSK